MERPKPHTDHAEECDAAYRRLVRSQLDPGLGIVTAVAVGAFALTGMLPVLGAGPGTALIAGLGVVGIWSTLVLRAGSRRARRRQDIDILVAADDPRVVAPLLEELRFRCARYEGRQMEPLVRLLPRVPAEDPLFRYRWYQEALHHALRETAQPETLVSLLKALGSVGDGRGIGYVRMLAENEGHFVRDERVAEAAREVLPVLRLRAGIRSQELLRPSLPPSEDPAGLLRSARPQSDGQSLMRPDEERRSA